MGGVDFGCGGGNWVVVVICKNVCPRFWPGGGNWGVGVFGGFGGRRVSGFGWLVGFWVWAVGWVIENIYR